MMKQRIKELKHGTLNEQDRLLLGQLLLKAGYCVSLGREKKGEKSSKYEHYVEYYDGRKSI